MQIQEGKFYRTRDGRRVGPTKYDHETDTAFVWDIEGNGCFTAKGYYWRDETDDRRDLVAEWSEDPPAVEPARLSDLITRATHGDASDWIVAVDAGRIVLRREPEKPLAVGDQVRLRQEEGVLPGGVLVARNDEWAWVQWPHLRKPKTVSVEDLKRAEPGL